MNQYLQRILLLILFMEQFILAISEIQTRTFLGNQGSSVELEYSVPVGIDGNRITCEWRHNGKRLPSNNTDKYQFLTPRSIKINDIVGEDEGDYTCSFSYDQTLYTKTIGRVIVLGAATFQPSQENLTAVIGDTVTFDTRIAYVGAGPQRRKQEVNFFQVYKGQGWSRQQVYLCRNSNNYKNSPCSSLGKFTVVMQGSDKFDFYLSLSNATVNDDGRYTVEVDLTEPISGSSRFLKKYINLTVTDLSLPLAPFVSITASRGTPNLGEEYSLFCNVSIRRYALLQSITISWHYPSGAVTRSTTEAVANVSLSVTIPHLSQVDEGIYMCLATVTKLGSRATLIANDSFKISIPAVELPEVDVAESFQLCIAPFFLSDCSALVADSQKRRQFESEIRNEIVQNIKERCPKCISEAVSTELIQPGTLKCSDTAARLIYRSTIRENGSRNASEIVDVIEEWVTSVEPGEATLQLWPFVKDLDSRCSVSISSLDSPYPTLGTGGDQARLSKVKENIESCLASEN